MEQKESSRQKYSNSFDETICWGVVGMFFAAYVGIWGALAYFGEKDEKTYEKARSIADSNKDGRTTLDEWSEVYNELGMPFDEANPRTLTANQLEKYIQNHEEQK